MSRSKNQHDTGWNPPNRFLKHSTKSKRRAAEKRYLEKVKADPKYYEENDVENDDELEDVWYWD